MQKNIIFFIISNIFFIWFTNVLRSDTNVWGASDLSYYWGYHKQFRNPNPFTALVLVSNEIIRSKKLINYEKGLKKMV